MNAPLRTLFGQLLQAGYDHHGLTLDLYGALAEDGYQVQHVCIPGTLTPITECVSGVLLDVMSAHLDDTLPSTEELRKASAFEARADIVKWHRDMEACGWQGIA